MGFAAFLGEVGFDEAKPTSHPGPLRYAAVIVPDLKGGEKRLVLAAPKESCTTKTRLETKLPVCASHGEYC